MGRALAFATLGLTAPPWPIGSAVVLLAAPRAFRTAPSARPAFAATAAAWPFAPATAIWLAWLFLLCPFLLCPFLFFVFWLVRFGRIAQSFGSLVQGVSQRFDPTGHRSLHCGLAGSSQITAHRAHDLAEVGRQLAHGVGRTEQ